MKDTSNKEDLINRNVKLAIENSRLRKILKKKQKEKSKFLLDIIDLKFKLIHKII
jgi:regulator of replication initiation timing